MSIAAAVVSTVCIWSTRQVEKKELKANGEKIKYEEKKS
jgi:hypothetical protein